MLNLSSQFGLLLVKQLTIYLLYPHCISLNHSAYHFTLTGAEGSLYDQAVESTLVQCLTSFSDDVMFIPYYKLSIAFANFGKQGRAATQKRRKKVKKGTFIGAFLAVLAKGLIYYQTTPDFTNGYKYSQILSKLHYSWDSVRIDNSSPLEPQTQERELNPEPGSPWAAGPMDCGTTCLHLSGIEPLKTDAENDGPCSETDQAEEINAPSEMLITAPNGGTKATTISFMSLKYTPATNQEPTQERGTGPQPGPMTTMLEQDNQVAKLRFLTNERTPGPSAILLPLDPSTQFPRPCLSQCPDEPPMENVKFGGGVLYRPKDPALQTYCHF
ncbi:hypothetical protein DSO57_1011418 [Entomophthora muscae]|uniref:Uncharacterized protein n=1 Tax=Entomophthora muscae TaxID=34485 RepID=A0ACC2US23_9FUNG|nr:hypothetical protein DSO57_1011418 [Entomophthora muscae]